MGQKTRELRILYLHPKSWPEAYLAERTQGLANTLKYLRDQARVTTPILLVTGKQDWDETMAGRTGSKAWDQWISYTATGTRADGEPRYHAYVLPYGPVGNGSARLVTAALQGRKSVYQLDSTGWALHAVLRMIQTNKRSFTEGWCPELASIPPRPVDLFTTNEEG